MNKVVIILGMHRSGTSSLAGLLQEAGVELGEVAVASPHNLKGNRENSQIMKLNDGVMNYSGGRWDNPPNRVRWNTSHAEERDRIVRLLSGNSLWGFKDPRTLFTLPLWLDRLQNSNTFFFGTFRHPLRVAMSLNTRSSSISIEDGVKLWIRYNTKLLDLHREANFSLLNFDDDPEPYLQRFNLSLNALKFRNTVSAQSTNFFDRGLRHQTSESEADSACRVQADILTNAHEIYRELTQTCEKGA